MEKSIENIWRDGFLEQDALVAPRVNSLFDQKSRLITEQLFIMGRNNLILIILGAAALLALSMLVNATVAGVVIFLLLGWLVLYGRQQAGLVKDIDKGMDSYSYLMEVKSWIDQTLHGYTKIYRVFYPAFFLTFFLGMWFSDVGDLMFPQLLERFPDMTFILGIPLYPLIVLMLMSALSSIFAGKIYQSDIKAVYGTVFKKLDEIISDMEELKK